MTSRKERTLLKSTQTEKEWGKYWFENVILKNLDPEYFTDGYHNERIWTEITKNPNTTIEIVESHLHLPWDWYIVCRSLIKSIDFVLKNHQSIPIDWDALSRNKAISLEDIENNLHLPWVFSSISSREDLTLEFVKKHTDKDWNILALSEQANLWEDIDKNAQNYCAASAINNPKLTLEFIERHMPIYTQEGNHWYLNTIFSMRLVTIDFIERHLNYLVSIGKSNCISYNPHVTVEFMKNHPEVDWRIIEISDKNPTITPEIVMANIDLNWDVEGLSYRSNFLPETIQQINGQRKYNWFYFAKHGPFDFAHVPEDKLPMLNWSHLSSSCHVKTADVIEKYKKYINWSSLSSSSFITMEFVRDHPEYPWNVKGLLLNPNCSLEMYEKNVRTVHLYVWENIFTQSFVREKEAFIEKRYREHLSAYRIQQYWNRSLTDPNYALCRKKLEADWLAYSTKTLLT